MRSANINSLGYIPSPPPSNPKDLSRYVYDELMRVAAVLALVAMGHLDKTYVAPAKPRDGDLRYADGASWNPGGGTGFYFYNGSSWVKL